MSSNQIYSPQPYETESYPVTKRNNFHGKKSSKYPENANQNQKNLNRGNLESLFHPFVTLPNMQKDQITSLMA